MALDNGVLRCENVDELQSIINTLLSARTALFRRRRGEAGAIQDFIYGQRAIIQALEFLHAIPSLTEQEITEIIENLWRRYRLGPTLGNGQACQYLLRFLHERFSNDRSIEWPGWEHFDW